MKFVSLFSGCGGLDLGFMQEGFQPISAFDISEVAVNTHSFNLGNHALVRDLTLGFERRISGCYVALAGSPCQGFSTAGKRRLDDPRNNLLATGVRLAVSLRPKVIVCENVPGLLQGEHRRYLEDCIAFLGSNGYQCQYIVANASELGVPQMRRRVVLLAWRTKVNRSLELERAQSVTLGDVLTNADGLPNHEPTMLARGSRDYRIARRISPGQKLCDVRSGSNAVHTWEIPEVFGHTTGAERDLLEAILRIRRTRRTRETGDADPIPLEDLERLSGRPVKRASASLVSKGYLKMVGDLIDLKHGFNGKFRRLRADSNANTVDTRFGDPRYFLHPSQHRGFSVREAARIQGFPDDFVFCGSQKEQFRMVGNAVPPPLARSVAKVVREAFF